MSSHSRGFTMIELLISTLLIVIVGSAIYIFFGNTFNRFFQLQTTAITVNNKSAALARMSQVIRGATTISTATNTTMTMYAYFYPQDNTLSQVTYTYDTTAKTVKVDRIPASGTAPNYTYNQTDKITRTILSGVTLKTDMFAYQDANGYTGPFNVATYGDIKLVTIDLNTTTTYKDVIGTDLKTTVVLRNRKTNL